MLKDGLFGMKEPFNVELGSLNNEFLNLGRTFVCKVKNE
jgi:hypothetical protein